MASCFWLLRTCFVRRAPGLAVTSTAYVPAPGIIYTRVWFYRIVGDGARYERRVTTMLTTLAGGGGLKIDWAQMPTYNTIMAVAAGVGLLSLVLAARELINKPKDFND